MTRRGRPHPVAAHPARGGKPDDYGATLAYLYNLEGRGMKFGLRAIRSLLAAAGHPERAFPALHIAGTNGKGSTASFLASAAMEAGLRTGLYTSPHLLRFTERIRVNGVELSEGRLVYYVRVLRPAIEEVRATFFEATTCIAFLYFADEGIDLAVVETGLGGRLDATNAITPLVSVITNVAVEHTEYLGTTLRAIAREKGGIIKPGVPIVTAAEDVVVTDMLRSIARTKGAPFHAARDVASVHAPRTAGDRVAVAVRGRTWGEVTLGLTGAYQRRNAALAAAAWALLGDSAEAARVGIRAPQSALLTGLARVRRNTGLRGRLERVRTGEGTYLLDVAHNPDALQALVAQLKAQRGLPAAVVFGVMRDKDYVAMLGHLRELAGALVVVAPRTSRALPARELYRAAREIGCKVLHGYTVAQGIRIARRRAQRRPVLVTGSHFVVGEAIMALRQAAGKST